MSGNYVIGKCPHNIPLDEMCLGCGRPDKVEHETPTLFGSGEGIATSPRVPASPPATGKTQAEWMELVGHPVPASPRERTHSWKCAKWMGNENQPCTCAPVASGTPKEEEPYMQTVERAARAMAEVEKMGAHPRLTDAVIKLQEARDAVADFVDLTWAPKRGCGDPNCSGWAGIPTAAHPVPASPRGTCTCDDTTSVRGSFERCPIESHNAPGVGVASGTPKCLPGCTLPATHTGRCAPYGVCQCGSVFDNANRDNHNLGCSVVSPAPAELDYEQAGNDARKAGYEFDAAHIGEGCRKPLDCRHRALLAAAVADAIQVHEKMAAQVCEDALARQAQSLAEAVPTPAQFVELLDVLDWAIREKHKQIDALHDADWVRPPEFDVNERDEQWLADFTRKGIEELAAIQVTLRNLREYAATLARLRRNG